MKRFLQLTPVFLFYIFSALSFGQAFITTWITNDTTVTIPTNADSGPYNYNIIWENLTAPGVGNGSFNGATGNYTITGLTNSHTYRVSITGVFPHFFMNLSTGLGLRLRTIEQWGNIQWKSFENAFMSCSNLTYNASDIPNLSQVSSMKSMFEDCHVFNGNSTINNWDTSNITNMYALFYKAYLFNQPLNNWNTSQVTNMGIVFYKAFAFNQPLDNWNTSNVTNMVGLFYEANSFNQSINNWDTSSVTNMYLMFYNNPTFNQPIDNWNTSNVMDMEAMFAAATAFNQPLNSWNTTNVTKMGAMFANAISFNQSLSNWNVLNASSVEGMFFNALSFNQSLSNWTLKDNVNLNVMFENSGIDCTNYSETLIGWANNPNTPNNRGLGAQGRVYGTDAVNARNTLINTKGWTITGDSAGTTTCTLNNNAFDLEALKVYPNPVEDEVFINYNHIISSLKVVNVFGQTVLEKTPHALDIKVSLNHLPTGAYLLLLESEGLQQTTKLVKQ